MNIETKLKTSLKEALKELGIEINLSDIVIEHSKSKEHGDYATNIALKYAKSMHLNPRDLADKIIKEMNKEGLKEIKVAGPGFINFFLDEGSFVDVITTILEQKEEYGNLNRKNYRINVEFVSANPTGDLHIGHARGAAVGDAICRILTKAGYDVTREFYVNDAGAQILHLGESLYARYMALFNVELSLPPDGYYGQDVIDIAKIIKEQFKDKYFKMAKEDAIHELMELGAKFELDKIKNDLAMFRVNFDIYSFEKEVRKNNAVENVLNKLKPLCYLDEGALFLKTTEYLDDKDRVLVKSNGDYTYLLPDIAYHLNKLGRGYDKLIDVLGADHHGYINRMKSSLMMFGYSKDILEVELIQMVRILDGDKEIKMSKRDGNALSMRELCEMVGVDACRYFFIQRMASAHLDFDLKLALERSSANPVYYAQYAHARLYALLDATKDIEIKYSNDIAKEKSELDLLRHLSEYSTWINQAAEERAPNKIAMYIQKLANLIHLFYTECRVIDRDNLEVTSSRLALVKASQIVLKDSLNLIGVSAPNKM